MDLSSDLTPKAKTALILLLAIYGFVCLMDPSHYRLLDNVDLAIHDVRGARVRTLVSDRRAAGSHRVVWDGRDESGRRVAPGAYFFRLEVSGWRSAGKVIVLR